MQVEKDVTYGPFLTQGEMLYAGVVKQKLCKRSMGPVRFITHSQRTEIEGYQARKGILEDGAEWMVSGMDNCATERKVGHR